MSSDTPTDQPTGQGTNFVTMSDNKASGNPLVPECGWLAINGNMDLSSVITGNSSSSVTKIYVSNQPPGEYIPKSYCVWVYGQGPSGFGSGELTLTFTDMTKSTYSLSLFSSTPAWHYVDYSSDEPGIVSVTWE